MKIGPHASDGVVRGGMHRDQVAGRIEVVVTQGRGETRESIHEPSGEVSNVKVDGRLLGLHELIDDGSADDVTRRELRALITNTSR